VLRRRGRVLRGLDLRRGLILDRPGTPCVELGRGLNLHGLDHLEYGRGANGFDQFE
jgi:hypothetical protein